ncbi:MAG: ABC transporter ATP-binding protein [Bacillota bacterium]|nr:ABC transporter ATP-binding protein [Bacillota bacterium]
MSRNKFDMDEEMESSFNVGYLKRTSRYLKPYKKQLFRTMAIMLVASAASLVGPYLIKDALDKEIPSKNLQGLIIISIIFLLTQLFNCICIRYKIMSMSEVGQSVILNIRKDLFEHLQKLPFSYYDSRPHGKILVRVVNYINGLSDLLSNGIINTITDLFTLFVILGFMFAIDVRLTLVSLLGLPLLLIAIFSIKTAQRKAWRAVNNKLSNLNAYVHESISGVKVTQSFAREAVNQEIFEDLNEKYRTTWMKCMRVQFLMSPFVDNISVIIVSAIYVLGMAWMNTGITVGVLVAFIGYVGRFWAPIANLANTFNSVVNGMSYLERIFETMDVEPNVKDIKGAVEMPEIQGMVEFDHVNFSYEEGQKILDDVSFRVPKGSTIALVGPTGAGKTTIINLLSRFYNVDSGTVLIDSVDISKVSLHSLRSQMGVMLQDSFIFSGTIMDNIRYGRLDATDEEVIAAAKIVRAHDFIKNLEDGYYTTVNERGSRFSAGQRQLIAFARALLADPAILILDEATSSIDTNTEMLLQQGLQELLKGRTSFIIAHRLSTIRNSSRIMFIDGGRIVEAGTHDELMRLKGKYYELYCSQFKFLDAV